MAMAAASAGGAREKAVKEAKMATSTNLGVRRTMLGKLGLKESKEKCDQSQK